jgi:hypothetical protein
MTQLNKAQREELATIIQSLMAAEGGITRRVYNNDADGKLGYWLAREKEMTLKLYSDFGIELSTLNIFIDDAA